ncbi:MAG: hypothetical protein PHP28_08520 [Actinomycetota bacterium]|nr:hypothetical protein [Actinomycetota bacterium]MDD5667816.1 hypothetical protein [Actinomycetota bacterium]
MTALRRGVIPFLLVLLLLIVEPGCGGRGGEEEEAWRREVDSSLRSLEELSSFRYRAHLQTWIVVSGQSVYGDERGEGSFLEGDFSVEITRISPAGEEHLAFANRAGELYEQVGDSWNQIVPPQAPSPLYDPEVILELLTPYTSISLQGEEERSGTTCRRYMLRLGDGAARTALPETAWSYFSSLAFESSCSLWVSDESMPPAAFEIEILGSDTRESLQRYRLLATLEPSDFDSAEVQPASPGE